MNVQKKIASKIMKCGVEKVWIDPSNEKVRQAITRRDVRRFIKEGVIKKIPSKKNPKIAGRTQQRMGSRKGAKYARRGKKTSWLKVIRPQRKLIKDLKDKKQLNDNAYRRIYKLVKGGMFRNKTHLMNYLKDKKMLRLEK
jgi:large subunit ribosomal protein L19e